MHPHQGALNYSFAINDRRRRVQKPKAKATCEGSRRLVFLRFLLEEKERIIQQSGVSANRCGGELKRVEGVLQRVERTVNMPADLEKKWSFVLCKARCLLDDVDFLHILGPSIPLFLIKKSEPSIELEVLYDHI